MIAVKLGLATFIVPYMFWVSPALLGHGTTMEVAQAVATALLGVWLLASATEGLDAARAALAATAPGHGSDRDRPDGARGGDGPDRRRRRGAHHRLAGARVSPDGARVSIPAEAAGRDRRGRAPLDAMGWVPATAGNISVRLGPGASPSRAPAGTRASWRRTT
jgi:hypothetical protein